MRFLLATLSLSYVRKHGAKTFLTLLGVIVGVATFSAIRAAESALVGGLRSTVDRMAGKAQLQITLEGGVPEELQESLQDVPGLKAQAPVIEQLVVAEPPELGSLLVVGVDLLGDREMRDYGFEGNDADLDDPLLFLAQSDSVALTRSFADRAGLKLGDTFRFRAPEGVKSVVVRGILSSKGFTESFGGNLIVVDVYAAQLLFGKGRRFDRLEVRLEDGVSIDEGRRLVEQAVGTAYQVETPSRRGAQMQSLIENFTAGFQTTSGFALAVGTFLIFNAFTVAVNRRRRDIGTLRALGATPRQVAALFLLEAAVIGAIGGALGLLLGTLVSQSFLQTMGDAIEKIYGLKDISHVEITLPLAVQAILIGITASLVGAFGPARAAARVHPTEALAKGRFTAQRVSSSPRRLILGACLLAVAIALPSLGLLDRIPLIALVLILGATSLVILAGPLSQKLLKLLSPFLRWLSPVAGQLSSDSLLGAPRRTAGTIVAMTLSLAFVIGTGGYMQSVKTSLTKWMDEILTSDLYVRASANFTRPDFRYPGDLRLSLLEVPGVRAVESYRGARLPYQHDVIQMISIEIVPMMARTKREFLIGTDDDMRKIVNTDSCVVSDNFHRRFGLGVGDVVVLSTPGGPARFPITSVLYDYTFDRGTVILDRATYLKHWKDDRVDTFDLSLDQGVDAGVVRTRVQKLLAEKRYPALISTREEFLKEIGLAIDAFYALVKLTLVLALVVAFLGIVTSLLISVAERTREIGILKSLGALGSQIRKSVVFEAVSMASASLLISIPAGDLISRFMETTALESFVGWRMPHVYPFAILGWLLIALPLVSALAAFVPARQAARVKVSEAIEYE